MPEFQNPEDYLGDANKDELYGIRAEDQICVVIYEAIEMLTQQANPTLVVPASHTSTSSHFSCSASDPDPYLEPGKK